MKCVACPDYDLCVECFSVGAELTPHKSNHPYRVMVSTLISICYYIGPFYLNHWARLLVLGVSSIESTISILSPSTCSLIDICCTVLGVRSLFHIS